MLKKTLTGAAAVAALFAFATPALANPMASTFGNTVEVTGPDGSVMKYHYNEDGSMTVITPDGSEIPGTFTIDEETNELCTTLSAGPQAGTETCTTVEGDYGVGDSWTMDTENGPVTIAIVEGR